MARRKKPTITEKRAAASKANGRRSQCTATPEGEDGFPLSTRAADF